MNIEKAKNLIIKNNIYYLLQRSMKTENVKDVKKMKNAIHSLYKQLEGDLDLEYTDDFKTIWDMCNTKYL